MNAAVRTSYRYTVFETNMGWVGILSSEKGLLRTTLPQYKPEYAAHLLGEKLAHATPSTFLFENTVKQLQSYYAGHSTSFTDNLDLSGATAFQYLVWEITRRIPYGETRSYSWVARQINNPRSMRAVGQALGKNPLPVIIPCHRVISSDGTPGGFSGVPDMKKRLLAMEATPAPPETYLNKMSLRGAQRRSNLSMFKAEIATGTDVPSQ